MEPYQERVVADARELEGRIDRLSEFFVTDTYLGIAGDEKVRLRIQIVHMEAYSEILRQRIGAWPSESG